MTVSALRQFGTSATSDALDRLGIAGQCCGIVRQTGESFAGPAWTVRYIPASQGKREIGDFVDDVPSDSVVVIDNGGRTDCTVWGGLMSLAAVRRRIAATVIDGAHRDSASVETLGFPLFSRGAFMRTGKDRVHLDALGATVRIGGVAVSQGDMIVGDRDGVIVIPEDAIDRVLETAEVIREAESRVEEAIRSGSSLAGAREAVRYQELQRRVR